ncbi:dienelactone hydrolase family protein [Lysobacter niastensis]|uniref:Dienelactone hydrolase family protein n=1 Tax=Lysobacter niastensis TaxID=380629 RepID=A0ABS0B661_9GAMM|nr:dienelactone hydrolase family protein [Lysobacter niastensis]MBF6024368.1 dienelactone hydrolase family protein [Lysobacter niastensis]
MAHWTDLDTPHGPVRAWRADPSAPSHSAVIVLQEIFGANAHIRSVAERFATAGFTALAPSLYDPVAPGIELTYTEADTQRGVALRNELGFDRAVDIVSSAADALQQREGLRVGVVGFCWGGSVSFLANTRLGLPAVSYYGARTVPFLDEPLRAPMMFHFGERDASIPPDVVEQHRTKQPHARIHVYPGADHAFNRDVDNHVFEPASAEQAWRRTLDFFAENLR